MWNEHVEGILYFLHLADMRVVGASGLRASAQGSPYGGVTPRQPRAHAEIGSPETPQVGTLDRLLLGALWPERLVNYSKARSCTVMCDAREFELEAFYQRDKRHPNVFSTEHENRMK